MLAAKSIINRIISSYQYYKNKVANIAETNYNLAMLHLYYQNFNDAYGRLRFTLKLDPNYPNARYYLAHCLYARNKSEQALEEYTNILIANKRFAAAEYMINFAKTCDVPEKLDQSLISSFFNSSADDRNSKAFTPLYQTILSVLTTSLPHHDAPMDILDLGCGTGTLFEFIKSSLKIKSSVGIDFANALISSPHIKNLYSELHCLDWHNFNYRNKFDLVLADRVLHFQASLSTSLKKLATMIHHDGAILFAVECYNNQAPSIDFNDSLLNFSYNKDYVLKEIKNAKLKVLNYEECASTNNQSFIVCLCTNM